MKPDYPLTPRLRGILADYIDEPRPQGRHRDEDAWCMVEACEDFYRE